MQRSSKRLREYNDQFRKNQRKQGISAPEPFVPHSKREGMPMSKLNLQIIQNHAPDSPISDFLKKIENGQMADSGSVSNAQFIGLFADYEKWHDSLVCCSTDEEYLINSADFYTLQVKERIDLITELADYMAQNKYKEYPRDRARNFWNTLIIGSVSMEANQVLTYNQAIPIVFNSDEEVFQLEADAWIYRRCSQAYLRKLLLDSGFNDLTIEKAAAFFREHYNVLDHHTAPNFGTEKAPEKQRIHLARMIMKSMYNRTNVEKQEPTA